MIINEITLKNDGRGFASYAEEFSQIVLPAKDISAGDVLCVNPRGGEMLSSFLQRGSVIDSFVSDDEWLEAASGFSRRVMHGYSHHPLLETRDEYYDIVIVCEDFALADDYDEMAVQYHRVLKRGGALLCGVWNMSYCGYLDALLSEGRLPDEFGDPLHGAHSFPIDTLRLRFERIGFSAFDRFAYSPPDDEETAEKYARVSKHMEIPADEAHFKPKLFFIRAIK